MEVYYSIFGASAERFFMYIVADNIPFCSNTLQDSSDKIYHTALDIIAVLVFHCTSYKTEFNTFLL